MRGERAVEEKKGFFSRLKEGLSKTRESFVRRMDAILTGRKVDQELLEELEALLITADFGVEVTRKILTQAEEKAKREKIVDGEAFRGVLRQVIEEQLSWPELDLEQSPHKPHVLLVVGVNGVGKTTTIGKLAAQLGEGGRKVMLAAGDTFRAAAVDQLRRWGERAGCPVVAQEGSADPAAVIYDAYSAAKSRQMDFLIADTAGRLHTKSNLMEELRKIKRVLGRQDPAVPQDIWLVLDATTGQNAVNQVRLFHESMGLSGLVMTKMDGTAKGGVLVGLASQFGIPVRYIGVGEGVRDLRPFEANAFVRALFEQS
ncbi:MAG: signal recognition particle-docking protein FtsY [Magnetococcales bacterium]|nr:signal recognition particle-docking protein FtsY [Magnetococcales bacterium]